MLEIRKPQCNYETEPLGVTGSPVFGWQLASDENDTVQSAYQLVIRENGSTIYDSGRKESNNSVCVSAEGFAVQAGKSYEWTVYVWDNHANRAEISSCFEGTIAEWKAQWIEPANGGIGYEKPINVVAAALFHLKPKGTPDQRLMPVTFLRKTFSVKQNIMRARLYTTAHGVYEIELNGKKVNRGAFDPQYSSYDKILFYQIYDVKEFLLEGENACGVMLADGWWGGRCGMGGECRQYGSRRAFLMQLEITYSDGMTQSICSDDGFHWMDEGFIKYADLFIGEKQDLRLFRKTAGFSSANYKETAEWKNVAVTDHGYDILHPQIGAGVGIVGEFCPTMLENPKGETVLDFGQNFAGFVRARVKAPAGTEVKLEHSEVLDEQGNYFNNIFGINKDQKDIFVCSGEEDCFEPHFTFHGFRYMRVSGLGEVEPGMFTGIAISTKMEDRGDFSCSNPDLNRLYQNSRWSQYANMISIPTDCPQREKAGWTGDIQIYAPTAAYHADMDAFLRRWLKSVAAEQLSDGEIPPIVPYSQSYRKIMKMIYKANSSSGWSDCCIIVPYVLYRMEGDTDVLREYYPVMQRWMEYIQNEAETRVSKAFQKKKHKTAREIENQKYLWNTGFHFGDWLVPSLKGNDTAAMKKYEPVFASIYYAYDTQILAEIAGLLGKTEDEKRYQGLNSRIKKAFAETYIDADGKLTPDMQGVYACALWFDMIPDDKKKASVERLCELIRKNENRLDTGFLATPVLLDTLTENGKRDLANILLYQEECPSWLYEIRKGATTIWEQWDGIQPDGKVGHMSYCHYAFGCVSDFLHRRIVGIRNTQPGYQKILLRPEPDRSLTWAKGYHLTQYGDVRCEWKKEDGTFTMSVSVPCNTSAKVVLPDGTNRLVGSGEYSFSCEDSKIILQSQ